MNVLRVLLATLALTLAAAASGQTGEQRGSIPPGQSKDGAAPSEGAIKGGTTQGGTILPGETGGIPDGRSANAPAERAARCLELQGTLRDECLAEEKRAGAGSTKGREVRETQPSLPPPQNPANDTRTR